MTYLIDNPLDEVKLPLQRGVQQQSQRVELHPEAVARPLRVRLLQVRTLLLIREEARLWLSHVCTSSYVFFLYIYI